MTDALCRQALACYGLDAAQAVFIRHNENLTFCVADQYLLRIHSPARGVHAPCTPADRRNELMLLDHLRRAGFPVQEPILTTTGDTAALLPGGICATLLRWIPGHDLTHAEHTAPLCRRVGEMAALLHQAARGFSCPGMRAYDAADMLARAETLAAMARRHQLGAEHATILRGACQAVAQCLQDSADSPMAIHCDLSPSNILLAGDSLVPIDFSLCGMGLPMTDLGLLLANFSSTLCRSSIVQGYLTAGGTLRHHELEAGYIHGLLGALAFHADTWPAEPWFPSRLLRWEKELLLPFIQGTPILDAVMNLIHLPQRS